MSDLVIKKISSVFNKKGLKKGGDKSRKTVNPRQALFAQYYTDPKSETFGNRTASALKAGFAPWYSKTIISPSKVKDNNALSNLIFNDERRAGILAKAERNLEELVDLDVKVQAVGAFGPIFDKKTKKPVMKINPGLVKIKQDTTKFVAETIGRNIYAKKVEMDANLTIDDLMNKFLDERAKKEKELGRNSSGN